MLTYEFPLHAPQQVKPGDVITTWCSVHMTRTPHRYEPGGVKKPVCTECEKEKAK